MSCTDSNFDDGNRVDVSAISVYSDVTRNSLEPSSSMAQWDAGDHIGVVAYCNGTATDKYFQMFAKRGEASETVSSFDGGLRDGESGEYQFFGMYPYRSGASASSFTYNLPNLQCPGKNSWDPDTDLMVARGDLVYLDSVKGANPTLNFSHILGWLRISFASFAQSNPEYAGEDVRSISISSSTPLAGNISVNLYPKYKLSYSKATEKTVTLDYSSLGIKLKDFSTFFTLIPGYSSSVTISLDTNTHHYTFNREGLTILSGVISETSISKQPGDVIEESKKYQDFYRTSLPDKPSDTDSLNILLLGHSFGLNCTEFVPNLTCEAGIKNVHFGRFYQANCSLAEHYGHLVADDKYDYSYTICGHSKWIQENRSISEVLNKTPWDIIVFQTRLQDEGKYNLIETNLNKLIDGILEKIYAKPNRKAPLLAWNLFFPCSDYGRPFPGTEEGDWADYCDAAQQVEAKTRVALIVSAGAGLQNLRATSLNIPAAYDFTRESDHYHSSNGAGSYSLSCAWYETLIMPIFNAPSVVGNTFRVPLGTVVRSGSVISTWDVVDDSNAELIQKCGAAAKDNKYSVTIVE